MLRTSLLTAALTLATAAFAQAGSLGTGDQPWRTSDCFKPNPPGMDRSEAQTLNLGVSSYDDYANKLSEYYACINAEVTRDQQRILEGARRAIDEAQQEAMKAVPFKQR